MIGGGEAHIKPISRASFMVSPAWHAPTAAARRSASAPRRRHVLGGARQLAAKITVGIGPHLEPAGSRVNSEFTGLTSSH